jgi:magnesium chelatase family protein
LLHRQPFEDGAVTIARAAASVTFPSRFMLVAAMNPTYKELRVPSSSEGLSAVRGRVIEARNRQTQRYQGDKATYSNAQMSASMIRKYCAIDTDGEKLLDNAITRLGLSGRAHDRILKVARTIADLDAADSIELMASQ